MQALDRAGRDGVHRADVAEHRPAAGVGEVADGGDRGPGKCRAGNDRVQVGLADSRPHRDAEQGREDGRVREQDSGREDVRVVRGVVRGDRGRRGVAVGVRADHEIRDDREHGRAGARERTSRPRRDVCDFMVVLLSGFWTRSRLGGARFACRRRVGDLGVSRPADLLAARDRPAADDTMVVRGVASGCAYAVSPAERHPPRPGGARPAARGRSHRRRPARRLARRRCRPPSARRRACRVGGHGIGRRAPPLPGARRAPRCRCSRPSTTRCGQARSSWAIRSQTRARSMRSRCGRRHGDSHSGWRWSRRVSRHEPGPGRKLPRRDAVHGRDGRRDAARPPRRRRPRAARADRRARARRGGARGGGRGAGADRARAARRDRPPRLDDGAPGRRRTARAERRAGVDARGAGDGRAHRPQCAHRDAPPARHAAQRRGRSAHAPAGARRRADAGRTAARGRPAGGAPRRRRADASSPSGSSCRPTGSSRRR